MPKLGDALTQTCNAVKLAKDRQILPYRQSHRHFDVGALEIHPMQNAIALPRHLRSEHCHAAGRRCDQTHDAGNGGRLAGPVAAKQGSNRAGCECE